MVIKRIFKAQSTLTAPIPEGVVGEALTAFWEVLTRKYPVKGKRVIVDREMEKAAKRVADIWLLTVVQQAFVSKGYKASLHNFGSTSLRTLNQILEFVEKGKLDPEHSLGLQVNLRPGVVYVELRDGVWLATVWANPKAAQGFTSLADLKLPPVTATWTPEKLVAVFESQIKRPAMQRKLSDLSQL